LDGGVQKVICLSPEGYFYVFGLVFVVSEDEGGLEYGVLLALILVTAFWGIWISPNSSSSSPSPKDISQK